MATEFQISIWIPTDHGNQNTVNVESLGNHTQMAKIKVPNARRASSSEMRRTFCTLNYWRTQRNEAVALLALPLKMTGAVPAMST